MYTKKRLFEKPFQGAYLGSIHDSKKSHNAASLNPKYIFVSKTNENIYSNICLKMPYHYCAKIKFRSFVLIEKSAH